MIVKGKIKEKRFNTVTLKIEYYVIQIILLMLIILQNYSYTFKMDILKNLYLKFSYEKLNWDKRSDFVKDANEDSKEKVY